MVINYASSNFEIIDANKVDEYKIKVDSGVKNGVFVQFLLKNELTGFEFAAGIPGTIGGAIYMNAGAFGGEIANIVESVTYKKMNNVNLHTEQAFLNKMKIRLF